MRTFNYSAIKEQKWDSDVLGLIAAIYKEAGKQELYLKQRPEELEKLVEIAKIQHAVGFTAIQFLAIHRKVSFSFIIRCFVDFVKLQFRQGYQRSWMRSEKAG